MVGLILGVNTLYRLFCFFKLFPMVGKGLTMKWILVSSQRCPEIDNVQFVLCSGVLRNKNGSVSLLVLANEHASAASSQTPKVRGVGGAKSLITSKLGFNSFPLMVSHRLMGIYMGLLILGFLL